MKAAVIGGSGYGAIELTRLIQKHPFLELGTVVSHSQAGQEFSEVYPHLSGKTELQLEKFNPEHIAENNEMVFLATPSGVSSKLIPQLTRQGLKTVDLSGDLRLRSGDEYESWYKHAPAEPALLQSAVYGLSEIYSQEIKQANLIANPGCYPTASLLGLMPLVKTSFIDFENIIIDAKSGVSGAGRGLSLSSHYAETNENFRAYKIGVHQHIPEMEQILQDQSGKDVLVTFTPHLVPMTRGMMVTLYLKLTEPLSTTEVIEIYHNYYRNKPFVRIRPEGTIPATKEVLGSNYCDIGLHVDSRTQRLTVVSVIDNLVKGASGQAIQNANLMNGWDETAGLNELPMYP